MPKSRHSHRKPQPKRTLTTPATAVSTQQSVTQPTQSAQPASSPKGVTSTPAATAVAKQYRYVVTELKSIGIATGLILALLAVLFFTLR